MTAVNRTDENSVKINMRVARHQRDLIDRAAQATGKTRTEFMLETACRAAEDALLDQRVFFADAEQYQRFSEALDAPAQSSEMLKTSLFQKSALGKMNSFPTPGSRSDSSRSGSSDRKPYSFRFRLWFFYFERMVAQTSLAQ